MPDFIVCCEIDVEADDPVEAARKGFALIQSLRAPQLCVTAPDGQWQVDLAEM